MSAGAPPHLISNVDGDEATYHQHYYEDQVLGEGEFGVVKMVHDLRKSQGEAQPLASKVLRKGVVFKDNTLYTPLKPEILRGEVEILRTLAGTHYCLKVVSIYETPKLIYMVTEFCGGGEMMEYVSKLEEDLTTEDVSRISYQLLCAVDHCARHRVIHRDIKPENIMFQDPTHDAELRLIDFGSGTMDPPDRDPNQMHQTFAGSAFYISPEMYQHTYTTKTDVWSAGATLYVLVAGYPADILQKAFNQLQTKDRDLRKLPGMPENMPDSFFEMLEKLLQYRHKMRATAGDMMKSAFAQFHRDEVGAHELSLGEVAAAAAAASTQDGSVRRGRAGSVSLKGSVGRHSIFMDFKKFERSLTTLLATMLSKNELLQLMTELQTRLGRKMQEPTAAEAAVLVEEEVKNAGDFSEVLLNDDVAHTLKLSVIQVGELKGILQGDLKATKVYVRFANPLSLPFVDLTLSQC